MKRIPYAVPALMIISTLLLVFSCYASINGTSAMPLIVYVLPGLAATVVYISLLLLAKCRPCSCPCANREFVDPDLTTPAEADRFGPRVRLWQHVHDRHGINLSTADIDDLEALGTACSKARQININHTLESF